jgi:hypothetical protein
MKCVAHGAYMWEVKNYIKFDGTPEGKRTLGRLGVD